MIKTKHTRRRMAATLLLLAVTCGAAWNSIRAQQQQQAQGGFDQSLFKGLEWRSIGPYRGGRVTAVAGVASQPFVYYFGGTGSGVWKSTDAGANWTNVSDGFFGTGSVGGIGICESDPNIIYVG